MTAINGFEKILAQLGKFTFQEFSLLKRFDFCSDKDGDKSALEIKLRTEDRNPNFELDLRFTEVTNLKINEFGNNTRIIGFDIQDVSSNQWENISWEVLDYEEDRLHFYAKTVHVISVRQL